MVVRSLAVPGAMAVAVLAAQLQEARGQRLPAAGVGAVTALVTVVLVVLAL